MKILLKKNVKFIRQDVEDAWIISLNDMKWDNVILPHDWAVTQPFCEDNSSGTGYLPGGTGWYRIHFDLPEQIQGKNISVVFEGVYKHAQVWCNQNYLGQWANGYTTFAFDLTGLVRQKENVLAIKVSHEDISDSRWYTGTGIERPVYLHIQEKVHAQETESKVVTLAADRRSAALEFSDVIVNNSSCRQVVLIRKYMEDELLLETKREIEAGEEVLICFQKKISNPKLWSIDNPQMIRFRTIVEQENGIRDEISVCTGIRVAQFHPDTGFQLNGEELKLKGVCLHDDAGSFGNAVPENIWRRRLVKLQKMGANTIRMSHNPHCKTLYRLCDEMGFLVIDELFDEWQDPKNKWWKGHNVYPPKHQGYYADYPQWYEKDVASFVKNRRNHPSIILWSIGNEIDYPNDPYCHKSFQEMTGNNDAGKPLQERVYDPDKPNAERLAGFAVRLVNLVKKYDRTRPVTLASAFPELSSGTGLFSALDVIGYNYKEALYEADHRRFPNQAIFGSENGHDYAAWKAVTEHRYIAGQCLWTGIDYLGETAGWPEHGSHAGHLTTAGVEKADYYFRQSLWSSEPMLYLSVCKEQDAQNMEQHGRSWDYPEGTLVTGEVYTNLTYAELFLNGKSLGKLEQKNADGKFVWCFPFEKGELCAAGYTAKDKELPDLTDRIHTLEKKYCLKMKLLDENLVADGSSIGQIQISIHDTEGNLQTDAQLPLELSVEGAAEFLHMDNGNLADTTPYTSTYRQTWGGYLMLYIRSTEQAGEFTVTAKSKQTEKLQVHFVTIQDILGNEAE